jgi:hypothetical protein
VKTEFPGKNGGLDLEPSVYELNDEGELHAQVVRACTEHAASLLHNPPNGGGGIDLAGLCRTQPTPGRTAFDFTRTRHHEIQLESAEDLRALVQGALTTYESRNQPVTRDEMLDYADARLAAEDDEWLDATKPGTQGHDWLPLIQKRKRQRG